MFFDSWSVLGRTLVVGVLAYLALILLLRVSGKRTLSKMNAFDFVITVALGSTLATVLLSTSVALARGMLAFAILIFLQLAITWLSVRSPAVRRLVKAEPTLLVHKGQLLRGAMRSERVTEDEVLAALAAHRGRGRHRRRGSPGPRNRQQLQRRAQTIRRLRLLAGQRRENQSPLTLSSLQQPRQAQVDPLILVGDVEKVSVRGNGYTLHPRKLRELPDKLRVSSSPECSDPGAAWRGSGSPRCRGRRGNLRAGRCPSPCCRCSR